MATMRNAAPCVSPRKSKMQLYGRPIFADSEDATLTAQVYEILREEICAGRWQVGQRLPGVPTFADETGLSRWPLQRAFEKLREEGYLRQEKRVGSFLASVNPKDAGARGVVGIAMPVLDGGDEPVTYQHLPHRLRFIIEGATERGYLTQVKYLRDSDDWRQISRRGAVFSDRVEGVISLFAFPHAREEDLALDADRLPFVFWGSNSSSCLPVVAGDTHSGFYRLTHKLIALGHKDIIMCIHDPQESERERENRFLGHERAMREARLEANHEAAEWSRRLQAGDLSGVREFLERFGEATAIISVALGLTHDIIAVAELMGWRVPEDVSVTGHGLPLMRPHDPDHALTRLRYDEKQAVDGCFTLLEQQRTKRRCLTARLLLCPTIEEGRSIAPPRQERLGSGRPASERESALAGGQ